MCAVTLFTASDPHPDLTYRESPATHRVVSLSNVLRKFDDGEKRRALEALESESWGKVPHTLVLILETLSSSSHRRSLFSYSQLALSYCQPK